MAKNTRKIIEVSSDVLVRSRFRPVNQKHVETIALSMRARGFDPSYPIPAFEQDGRYVTFGGEHRLEAAKIAEIATVFIELHPAPANEAEHRKMASRDNLHAGNGKDQGRMAFAAIEAHRTEYKAYPKAEDLAADMGISTHYAEKFISVFKNSHKALRDYFLGSTNAELNFNALEHLSREDKAQQALRVSKLDFKREKKYRPALSGDTASTLKYLSGMLGGDGALIVTWLTSDDEAVSGAALAKLQSVATAYYNAGDEADVAVE